MPCGEHLACVRRDLVVIAAGRRHIHDASGLGARRLVDGDVVVARERRLRRREHLAAARRAEFPVKSLDVVLLGRRVAARERAGGNAAEHHLGRFVLVVLPGLAVGVLRLVAERREFARARREVDHEPSALVGRERLRRDVQGRQRPAVSQRGGIPHEPLRAARQAIGRARKAVRVREQQLVVRAAAVERRGDLHVVRAGGHRHVDDHLRVPRPVLPHGVGEGRAPARPHWEKRGQRDCRKPCHRKNLLLHVPLLLPKDE